MFLDNLYLNPFLTEELQLFLVKYLNSRHKKVLILFILSCHSTLERLKYVKIINNIYFLYVVQSD